MNFNFCGTFGANTDENAEKGYFYRSGETKGGNEYASVNLYIQSSQNNRAYVELFGMASDVIKTYDINKKPLDVDWKDRKKSDVVKNVASFRKNIISLGTNDRHEFVSSYDMVQYIKDNIDELVGKRVVVTGQVNRDFYGGKIRDRFQINNLYLAGDKSKDGLNITGNFFYTKDSIDTSDWKEDKKVIFNGYSLDYVADVKAQKYVSRTLVFDASKVDFDNPQHVKRLAFTIKQFGLEYDVKGKKIVNKLDAKKVYSTEAVIKYVNGAQEVEFDESLLTENQKEAIELGIKTIDDFKPKGGVFGDRVIEYKLSCSAMKGDKYKDNGYAIEDMTVKEFEEDIYHLPSEDDNDFMNIPDDVEDEIPFLKPDKKDDDDGDDGDDDLDLF